MLKTLIILWGIPLFCVFIIAPYYTIYCFVKDNLERKAQENQLIASNLKCAKKIERERLEYQSKGYIMGNYTLPSGLTMTSVWLSPEMQAQEKLKTDRLPSYAMGGNAKHHPHPLDNRPNRLTPAKEGRPS